MLTEDQLDSRDEQQHIDHAIEPHISKVVVEPDAQAHTDKSNGNEQQRNGHIADAQQAERRVRNQFDDIDNQKNSAVVPTYRVRGNRWGSR